MKNGQSSDDNEWRLKKERIIESKKNIGIEKEETKQGSRGCSFSILLYLYTRE